MTKKELVERSRRALAEFAALPPEEQIRQLVANGTINEKGQVLMGDVAEDEEDLACEDTRSSVPASQAARIRGELRFSEIVAEAKTFLRDWPWYEITAVEVKYRGDKNGGADWIADDAIKQARIEIGTDACVFSLYHEVFHSAFHGSPLHDGYTDEKWGNAWCDTFRYYHDNYSDFRQKIDLYRRMTYQEAKDYGDWSHDREYAYPCSRIVEACGGDYARTKQLWFEFCARRAVSPVLNEYFRYDIATGLLIPGRSSASAG